MAIPLLGIGGTRQGTSDFRDSSFNRNTFNSERPLKPTNQRGVAIDGRGNLPEGRADMTDKVIGKMQKVTPRFVSAACLGLIGLFIYFPVTYQPNESCMRKGS